MFSMFVVFVMFAVFAVLVVFAVFVVLKKNGNTSIAAHWFSIVAWCAKDNSTAVRASGNRIVVA